MDVASTINSIVQQKTAGASGANATDKTKQTQDTKAADYGKTVGNPQLSDKAAEYYKQLKGKYSNMEFVLVSKDEIENAKQNAAKYASKDKMVVLVDEEKIERMATDESYRKKYEGIISMSQSQLGQMADKMSGVPGIKGFGMQVNDNGTASFFAIMKKSSDQMNARVAKKREEKKAQKKEAEKKAEKKTEEKEREIALEAGRVKKAISMLPDKYRMTVHLMLVEGIGYEELSEMTGIKESTLRSYLMRGKAKLLSILSTLS